MQEHDRRSGAGRLDLELDSSVAEIFAIAGFSNAPERDANFVGVRTKC
jgi:hypothetical protein